MKLEVNGIEYTNFTSLNVELHLDALANTFTFEAANPGKSSLPFKRSDPVRVIVDGEPVLTGAIERISGSYDADSHNITIQGRDKPGDIVDSTIDDLGGFRSPISLKSVIEKVVANIGADITVVDNANPKLFRATEDIAEPEPGQSAFDFIETLARHRQVLLTSNEDGAIVIEKIPGPSSGGILQNILGADNNNILSGDFSYDDTERYHSYKFVSSLNPITINETNKTKIETIVSQKGAVIDTGVRTGRQMVINSEDMFSDGGNIDRATWEANIRKARSQTYSCTVQGYRPDSGLDIWRPNRLATVVDEFADINAELLINSVSFSLSVESGKITALTFMEKNAYTLELTEPVSQELGFGF